jgi:Conserved region of Rad21 / Rec8 like protein
VTGNAVQSQAGSSKKREREQHILMSSLTPPACTRSEAAKCFYDVLVLQAKGLLHMAEQKVEYEELKILLLDAEN